MATFLTFDVSGFEKPVVIGNAPHISFENHQHQQVPVQQQYQQQFSMYQQQPPMYQQHQQFPFQQQPPVQQMNFFTENVVDPMDIETITVPPQMPENDDISVFTDDDWVDYFGEIYEDNKSPIDKSLDDWEFEQKLEREGFFKNDFPVRKMDNPNVSKLNNTTIIGYDGLEILSVICKTFEISKEDIVSCDRVFIVERKTEDIVRFVDLGSTYKSKSIKFRDKFVTPTAVGLVKINCKNEGIIRISGLKQFGKDKTLLNSHINNYVNNRKKNM